MSTVAPVIAIDGPAAAGKGTLAQQLAADLNFHYLDSGKIYRAVALQALARNLPPDDPQAMQKLAQALTGGELAATGHEHPKVGEAASQLAQHMPVREALLPLQRDMRRLPGLVADGRDMATVVFPDAVLKVFLTADAEVRAARRQRQLAEKGINATISAVLAELSRRDERDSVRIGLPPVAETVIVDSTRHSAHHLASELAALFRRRWRPA